MMIAVLHPKGAHAAQLLRRLNLRFSQHALLSWTVGEEAPSHDIRLLLALGPVPRALLDRQPKLEIVQTMSAGYETVDVDAASQLGIWVSNAPAGLTGNAVSVAEFAVMLLIGASRHLKSALQSEVDSTSAVGTDARSLRGKTLCVVGLGSIGRSLVELLRPFGLKIVATDRDVSQPPEGVTLYAAAELNTALADVDYVVICVPGSKDNEKLINAAVLSGMKLGAILVNVARGSVVDESALCAALRSGRISAVGLDVVRTEPVSAENPLLEFPQALVTPHIAGDTDLSMNGTVDYIVKVVQEWEGGIKPCSAINDPKTPRRTFRAAGASGRH
jgi:phosphoglycerate dehydrogenase-like enzyme